MSNEVSKRTIQTNKQIRVVTSSSTQTIVVGWATRSSKHKPNSRITWPPKT
ncbi:hypothetical protein C1H46_037245 [Malus baccata]|uniref:Uncharacterized protein n=1 Tax=Malus baccata TaxID=106549 RepID=A0A540KSQ7_MALBA|nr:hypothetical protein C1H46_037245 [Malus baccata]